MKKEYQTATVLTEQDTWNLTRRKRKEIALTVSKALTGHLIPAKDEFSEYEDSAVEVGALVTVAEVGKGHGKRAVIEGVKTGKRKGAKRVKALVHVDNVPANKVMKSLAGDPYHNRLSNYVRDPNGLPSQMNVYDITNVEARNI